MTYFIDSYRFTPELDLVHNLTRVFGVFFCEELAKAIPLMCHRNTVLRKVNIH